MNDTVAQFKTVKTSQSRRSKNKTLQVDRLIYSVSQKSPPPKFSDIFPKQLRIFSPDFTYLLCVPIYAGLQIFIQLSATLTKLCHIKRDHHNMLKMSTETHVGWLHLIWRNFVKVADN